MQTTVTPLSLEISDFSSYDLIIDARSPREFAEDHLPGAVNFPVVDNDEYAQVGTMHKDDKHAAYLIGVMHSLRNMANWIEAIGKQCRPTARILVYCFRGGKRSKLWSDTLRTIGYKVDVLPGGWKNYRRWVIHRLELMPRELCFKVVTGFTGCGKTRLLQAIANQGGQVLDLEGLAVHRGSLIGSIPGQPQPSQKLFDSTLLSKLMSFDPSKPIFLESESKKIGNVQLPESLMDAMQTADLVHVEAPMSTRLKVWHEDFRHFVLSPSLLLDRVQHLIPLIGKERFKSWELLADAGLVDQIFEELMKFHYDPAYLKSSARLFRGKKNISHLTVEEIDSASLSALASKVMRQLALEIQDSQRTAPR